MNIVKISSDELIFFDAYFIDIQYVIKKLTEDISTIFYIVENDKIVGSFNKYDIPFFEKVSLDKPYIFIYDHHPFTEEIISIFECNSNLTRISVWVNGEFYAEFRNIDSPYLPKTISKNIMCLKYLEIVRERLIYYLFNNNMKKIGIFGDEKLLNYLITTLGIDKIQLIKDIFNFNPKEFDIIFDFKFGGFLLKKMCFDFENVKQLSQFLIPFLMDELIMFLREKDINFLFLYDDQYAGMNNLSELEKKVKDKVICFDELINNEEYVNEFSVEEKDKKFLIEREFLKTCAFYSDFTIRQTDVNSGDIKISEGIRFSGKYPECYENEIHFFGPCSILGLCGSDNYTFEYQLQNLLNTNNKKMRVFNHGIMNGNNAVNSIIESLRTDLKSGDYVFIYFMEKDILCYDNVIKISEIFEGKKMSNETLFFDVIGHCNRKANAIYAQFFYDFILKTKLKSKKENRISYLKLKMIRENQVDDLEITNPNIYSHLIRIKKYKNSIKIGEKVGSITMYAAPFTVGHKYLVDEAIKKVDILIVFCVMDNFHTMYSLDRLEILRYNLKDYHNVIIIPTDSYFASKQYFPEYSSKICGSGLSQSVYFQEEMFAKYVVPFFNISCRFMGEETKDSVTNYYNEVVKEICKRYNISLYILPRYKIEGEEVSGTDARFAVKNKDFESMRKLLPASTIKYIIEKGVKLW